MNKMECVLWADRQTEVGRVHWNSLVTDLLSEDMSLDTDLML